MIALAILAILASAFAGWYFCGGKEKIAEFNKQFLD